MTACMSSGSNRLTCRPAAPAMGGRGRDYALANVSRRSVIGAFEALMREMP